MHSVAASLVSPFEHLFQCPHGVGIVENGHSLEKRVAIQSRADLLIGLFDEEMKMITHHDVSDDAQTEEAFELAHQCDKMLFLSVTEDEAAVYDA